MPNIDYSAFISDLEAKRSELETEINAIDAALQGARILVGAKGPSSNVPTENDSNQGRRSAYEPLARFANMTIPKAAEIALRDVGHPMSTRQLHDALVAGGFETKAASFITTIGSVLNRHSKEVGTVVRLPNGWGLGEWQISTQQAA